MNQKKILIADDSELNRAILVDVLEHAFEVLEVADGREAIAALQAHRDEIGVLLLDVVMPEADGFEVLEYMNRHHLIEDIPVIMISAETSGSYIERAFKLGASDYVSRPFVPSVILRRIMNTILLHNQKQQLMNIMADRYYREEKNSEMMVSILGHVVELRSGEGGCHMSDVSIITGMLLHQLMEKTDRYGLDQTDVDAIQAASCLHDIGKLLVPEEILTKPKKLTEEEFEVLKRHTLLGARIITDLPVYRNERMVQYAMEVCRWHHERWNGEGYPDGLKGDDIPVAAQVVSIADAYDALISKRAYKEAFSHEKAMAMINGGECGSFNPLLLDCLNELSDQLALELPAHMKQDQSHQVARRMVEEIFHGKEIPAARVALQLEEERAKRQFFADITGELWFEYTTHPDSLTLSPGAVRATGLPAVVIEPRESAELRTVISEEAFNAFCDTVRAGTLERNYVETQIELKLNGAPRWCQLAVLITWSEAEHGHCSSLLGRILNIDERYRGLDSLTQDGNGAEAQSLTPMMESEDGVLRLTRTQVNGVLRGYSRLFQVVRLVDPDICMQLVTGMDGQAIEKRDHCYAVWEQMRRCDNCISQAVLRTRKSQTKLETVGTKVFYVISSYVEVAGRPYALELVNPIESDDMVGDGGQENILNQLLVRNRQVYVDSLTKIHNRRYFDEQLSQQEGEFAVAMIDVDYFKEINDNYGHQAGDAALYRIAQAIKSEIRGNDELVRYGGDEFFVLFHDMPSETLEKKLQAIRAAVDRIEMPEYPGLKISASIGGAKASGKVTDTTRKADATLMQKAKRKKDSVVLYGGEEKR